MRICCLTWSLLSYSGVEGCGPCSAFQLHASEACLSTSAAHSDHACGSPAERLHLWWVASACAGTRA